MRLLKSNQLKAINKPGMYRVGLGLYLRMAPGGSKQFVQRIVIQGKRCDIGLGGWPATSLSEAKEKALCNRAEILTAANPIIRKCSLQLQKKRKNLTPSFAQLQEKTLDGLKATWRNPKTAKNWKEGMDKYVDPVIGNVPINEVSREDVLNILMPLWIEKPNLARKTRQRMSAVFKLAMAYGYIEINLAGEAIDGALPKQNTQKSHHRALPYSRIPKMLEAVLKADANMTVMAAMCWLTLTACRSSEARNARWGEIDLKHRIWRIPGSRMKANKEHRVPITEGMILILDIVKPLKNGSGFLFPSSRCQGKPVGENSFCHLIRYIGYEKQTTAHGLRSSFRDWAAERGINRELAEQALAHTVQGVEGSYFRSDLFRNRRAVMKRWDEHCMKKCQKILVELAEKSD